MEFRNCHSLEFILTKIVILLGEYESREPSIVEIRAPTSDSVLQDPVPSSHSEIAQLYEVCMVEERFFL